MNHTSKTWLRKAAAHAQRGMNRLRQAVPASVELLTQAAAEGEHLALSLQRCCDCLIATVPTRCNGRS
ncbi:MAG: hypothetical protein IPH35_16160 [Rhodoferax sp.]|nr:hypothetical protein [Rhodoferax sp.]